MVREESVAGRIAAAVGSRCQSVPLLCFGMGESREVWAHGDELSSGMRGPLRLEL